jgi:hypothetical protein
VTFEPKRGRATIVLGGSALSGPHRRLRPMRFWICDISSPNAESRFEMDFEEPPSEGSVLAPGIMVYKVNAIVRLPGEMSPGVIEVERVTEPEPVSAADWPSYRPGAYPH